DLVRYGPVTLDELNKTCLRESLHVLERRGPTHAKQLLNLGASPPSVVLQDDAEQSSLTSVPRGERDVSDLREVVVVYLGAPVDQRASEGRVSQNAEHPLGM